MLGSPSALADAETRRRLQGAAERGGHTLYVPRGALWGCEDIERMDRAGTLQALTVTLRTSPALPACGGVAAGPGGGRGGLGEAGGAVRGSPAPALSPVSPERQRHGGRRAGGTAARLRWPAGRGWWPSRGSPTGTCWRWR
ncbi:hypothetical protein Q9966_016746 [Columba livia]|nr:hypothetical protein Q9966_016746 [Columba livia]